MKWSLHTCYFQGRETNWLDSDLGRAIGEVPLSLLPLLYPTPSCVSLHAYSPSSMLIPLPQSLYPSVSHPLYLSLLGPSPFRLPLPFWTFSPFTPPAVLPWLIVPSQLLPWIIPKVLSYLFLFCDAFFHFVPPSSSSPPPSTFPPLIAPLPVLLSFCFPFAFLHFLASSSAFTPLFFHATSPFVTFPFFLISPSSLYPLLCLLPFFTPPLLYLPPSVPPHLLCFLMPSVLLPWPSTFSSFIQVSPTFYIPCRPCFHPIFDAYFSLFFVHSALLSSCLPFCMQISLHDCIIYDNAPCTHWMYFDISKAEHGKI